MAEPESKPIFLVGMMGSGKSTVGRLLARELGWDFCDLDSAVESRTGRTPRDWIENDGEPSFRERESETLREETRPQRVIATGGGAVLDEWNRDWMRTQGRRIYLRVSPRVLSQRLASASEHARRPLLGSESTGRGARIEAMLASRSPHYAESEFEVDAEAQPAQVVQRIVVALSVEHEASETLRR